MCRSEESQCHANALLERGVGHGFDLRGVARIVGTDTDGFDPRNHAAYWSISYALRSMVT
jgi:hypothetical protein